MGVWQLWCTGCDSSLDLLVTVGAAQAGALTAQVDALKEKRITKPVVAWVSGTCAKLFKSEVQFGHAGAKSGGQAESAQVPPRPLERVGVQPPSALQLVDRGAAMARFDTGHGLA
jgi:ATP citrate (pro-S)-lyase